METPKIAVERPTLPEFRAWLHRTSTLQGQIAKLLEITDAAVSKFMEEGFPVEHCLRLSLITGIPPEKFCLDRKTARILKLFGKLPPSQTGNANE